MFIYTVLSFAGVENGYTGSPVIDRLPVLWVASSFVSATITDQMFQLEVCIIISVWNGFEFISYCSTEFLYKFEL
jgi:hypothetical protein